MVEDQQTRANNTSSKRKDLVTSEYMHVNVIISESFKFFNNVLKYILKFLAFNYLRMRKIIIKTIKTPNY